jgi:hypothetical protein
MGTPKGAGFYVTVCLTFSATFPFSFEFLFLSRWSLITFSNKPQHWRPPFVSSKEHPRNATQKEAWKRPSGRRLIPSGQRLGPQNNHPITIIHRASSSSDRHQGTRRAIGTTGILGGGAPHEHLRTNHSATTATSRDQNTRGSTLRFGRGDQSNYWGQAGAPPSRK